jgi:hypothetical protein
MSELKAVLFRLSDNGKQTLGRLQLYKGLDTIFEAVSLELPFKANMRNISAIPKGTYKVMPRESEKYGKHFEILNVKGRDYILIHPANYYNQLRGCIALGSYFYDINADGEHDITNSRRTIKALLNAAPQGFELTII